MSRTEKSQKISAKRNQKSTRWAEKSGILETAEEGEGRRKPPIRKTFLSPVRRGRIPAVSLARAVVYSTRYSVIITTEIIFSLYPSCFSLWYIREENVISEEDKSSLCVYIGDLFSLSSSHQRERKRGRQRVRDRK